MCMRMTALQAQCWIMACQQPIQATQKVQIRHQHGAGQECKLTCWKNDTWVGSSPKYLYVSKYSLVSASVAELVMMYHCTRPLCCMVLHSEQLACNKFQAAT